MASVRNYAIIYVVLLLLGTTQFLLFETEALNLAYGVALTGVAALSVAKALLVAGYFQHLVHEPRSITYLMATAVFMVFLLTVAAGFSIQ